MAYKNENGGARACTTALYGEVTNYYYLFVKIVRARANWRVLCTYVTRVIFYKKKKHPILYTLKTI